MEGQLKQVANRQSEVSEEVTLINQKLTKLEDIVGGLEERLSSVLRQQVPQCGDGCDKKSLVPFAELLDVIADRINCSGNRLSNIIDRLEL